MKILRKNDFLILKEFGKKIRPVPWLILNVAVNPEGQLRVGWTISRKVGTAVVRNKLKRWCRAYFRTKDQQAAMDLNVVVCPQGGSFFKLLAHEAFVRALDRGWDKAHKGRSR